MLWHPRLSEQSSTAIHSKAHQLDGAVAPPGVELSRAVNLLEYRRANNRRFESEIPFILINSDDMLP